MAHAAEGRLGSWLAHYEVWCLALAVLALSLLGVGDVRIACGLGLILCGLGLARREARVDLRFLLPLALYPLVAMAASYGAYGNVAEGYGVMHSLFPVIYLLAACLSREERQMLRCCCGLLAGAVAAAGIGSFVWRAVSEGRVGRLAGLLGNPNALGIFLVVGWFILLHCKQYSRQDNKQDTLRLPAALEPILLLALALTLSMGSFLALAVGLLVMLVVNGRTVGWGEAFGLLCRLLAKAALGLGTGLLIYLAAVRSGVPWLCLLPLAYGVCLLVCWDTYERFLADSIRGSRLIAGLGGLIAAVSVLVRPSALLTLGERLEMMASGLKYLTVSPLLGVGPFRWRFLDMNDGGKFFNTWHIHNVPIHIGVEMGLIAMGLVVWLGIWALFKPKEPNLKAGAAAFICHNLIDTSFFYLGITALTLAGTGEPQAGGQKLGPVAVKAVFALFTGVFAWGLYCFR